MTHYTSTNYGPTGNFTKMHHNSSLEKLLLIVIMVVKSPTSSAFIRQKVDGFHNQFNKRHNTQHVDSYIVYNRLHISTQHSGLSKKCLFKLTGLLYAE